MAPLKLKFACGDYDRMEALRLGAVKPEGIDLDCLGILSPRETFDRMTNKAEFDVCEMSSSQLIAMKAAGDDTFVGLPVIPSRIFRHSYVFLNRRSGLKNPKDLEGKRIGVGLYTQTAAVWIRGILAHDHGVDFSNVTFVQGAIDAPGPHGDPKVPPLTKPVRIIQNETPRSLTQMLADGELDALTTGTTPKMFGKNPDLVRLFPDYREREKDHYRRTGLYPIMHVIAIRREVFDRNPWIAQSLYTAFVRSKEWALERMHYTGVTRYMLPWMFADLEEIQEVFGGDPWPYGVEANRGNFETLMDYMSEQGVISTKPRLEDVFAEVT